MSVTHGGRAKQFRWALLQDQLAIENEDGLKHHFSVQEISEILESICQQFGESWFPLANNVEKMYNGTEIAGFGMTIYQGNPGDTLHAQGSSYLGVVLDEVGILEWNGKSRGIEWRLTTRAIDSAKIRKLLAEYLAR